jgi:ribosomal protein S12 methylthiotransferase
VDLIRRIRAGVPGIALRTTFIVGFPGETDEYFRALLSFIEETKFERLGLFMYSQEEGTRAGKMEGQISEALKKKRRDQGMAAQLKVAREVAQSFVGRELRVLVEGPASQEALARASVSSWEHGLVRGGSGNLQEKGTRGVFIARGEADAPDIDGRVYVRGKMQAGQFARVRVVGHTDYDLLAEPV